MNVSMNISLENTKNAFAYKTTAEFQIMQYTCRKHINEANGWRQMTKQSFVEEEYAEVIQKIYVPVA